MSCLSPLTLGKRADPSEWQKQGNVVFALLALPAPGLTLDDKQLLVGVGKGNQTRPNRPEQQKLDEALARPKQEGGYRRIPFPHVGTTLSGTPQQ